MSSTATVSDSFRASLASTPSPQSRSRSRQTAYLLTGGTGGLGLEVAAWLIARGARKLYLNARSAPLPAAAQTIATLRETGASIHVVLADVSDADALSRLFSAIAEPLDGIFHLAGVLHDGAIENQTDATFAGVLAPKVDGAWNLHQLSAQLDLTWFVLFSSTAAVLGNAGQANHAAANSFLDELAHSRRAQGLPAISLNWGAWSQTGSAAGRGLTAKLEEAGIDWIAPQAGIRALETALQHGLPQQIIAPIRWEIFRRHFAGRPIPSLLRELIAPLRVSPRAAAGGVLDRLKKTPSAMQFQVIANYVAAEVQSVLHLAKPPEPNTGFFDLGMDSLMTVELRNRINRALGIDPPLSSTILFDYPSTSALASCIAERLGLTPRASAPEPPDPVPQPPPQLASALPENEEELSLLLADRLAAVFAVEER